MSIDSHAGNVVAVSGVEQYTLHIPFAATDLADARDAAVIYTEGLSTLRAEVSAQHARLSSGNAEENSEPVFCGALGPDGEWCADVPGHPWPHRTPGLNGDRWGQQSNSAR